jgi:hypothetical protein
MTYDSDRSLSPEDLEFITKVRELAKGLGLYFNIYINPIIHNGALIVYDPQASYQKIFDGARDAMLMAQIQGFFEGYMHGRRHGSDQGRRGMQSELRSLLGIEESDGQLYISH